MKLGNTGYSVVFQKTEVLGTKFLKEIGLKSVVKETLMS